MPTFSIEEVREIVIAHLRGAGAPHDHAETQAAMLIDAELRGLPSHGVLRLPRLLERIRNGVLDPTARGEHTWRAEGWLDVDGDRGFGPVVAEVALDAAIDRLDVTGCVLVTIRRSNHLGMLSRYAEQVAERGDVLIAMTTSEAMVHPWNGSVGMLGTNPIAMGIPATPHPFVVDLATSLVSMGKIHDFANRGEPLPAGWARDANGDPTTDASDAVHGSIAPFGGAKGYALGLAVELLVASLTGSAYGRDVTGTLDDDLEPTKGDLFIVIRPRTSQASALVSRYLDAIRDSAPALEASPVLVPGDRSRRSREERLHSGIHIPDAVWNRLAEAPHRKDE